jgi:plasmid stabilization system protein ParE
VTVEVRLRPEAEQDLLDAASWYEGQRSGLGKQFLDEVVAIFATIAKTPVMYPIVHRNTRRAVARVGRNSVLAYCAAWEVWESTSFAFLNIEVWSTKPNPVDKYPFNVTVKGGIRPLHRPLDKPMFHRIEVAIIHMHRIIRLITNSVSPEPALPDASFAACNPHRRAPFTVR